VKCIFIFVSIQYTEAPLLIKVQK